MKEQHEKKENKQEEAIQHIIKEEKPRIEKYLKYNYKNVKEVKITKVDQTPMGTIYLDGYINQNKELDFSADIYESHVNKSIDVSEKLAKLAKYEKDKSVTEIENEENGKE